MPPIPQPIDPNLQAERLRRCEARISQLEDQIGMIRGKHRPPRRREWRIPEITGPQYLTVLVILMAIGVVVEVYKARKGSE